MVSAACGGVHPECPLVKASIIAGASFPIAVAVGDFLEAAAWLIEQRVGLGPAFDRPRFQPMGSVSNQVTGQIQQQILPELAPHFAVASLADRLAVLAQRIDAAFEADPLSKSTA